MKSIKNDVELNGMRQSSVGIFIFALFYLHFYLFA